MALGGKVLRGSSTADAPAVHLLAALDQETGGVLAQGRVPAETNEHKGRWACSRAWSWRAAWSPQTRCSASGTSTTQDVADGGPDLIKVDDNQPTLKADIATAFEPAASPSGRRKQAAESDKATTTDKYDGRGERRRLQATTMLAGYIDWPGRAQVGRLERTVIEGGEVTVEVQGLITSVSWERAGAATLLSWTRGHWGIENRLHYVRDVTMGGDANRTRSWSGPQVRAALRNAAISHL